MGIILFSLKIHFTLLSAVTVILGLLINFAESRLPVFLVQIYRYGKFGYKGSSPTKWAIEVPKSWFKHFYIFGTIWTTFLFFTVLCLYLNYIAAPPPVIVDLFDYLGPGRATNVSSAAVFVASFLLMIQCWRRTYETSFISVFSPGKMWIGHYMLGFLHYFAAGSAIVMEAPGFSRSDNVIRHFRLTDLSLMHYTAMTLFLWAWIVQYDSACILGDLRKNPKGKVVTVKHYIPQGRMFNLVSCPHLLCEIIMYCCLNIILWGNTTFPFILAWVLTNQIEMAMLSHWWYKEHFPNYPKSRKALIPFLL